MSAISPRLSPATTSAQQAAEEPVTQKTSYGESLDTGALEEAVNCVGARLTRESSSSCGSSAHVPASQKDVRFEVPGICRVRDQRIGAIAASRSLIPQSDVIEIDLRYPLKRNQLRYYGSNLQRPDRKSVHLDSNILGDERISHLQMVSMFKDGWVHGLKVSFLATICLLPEDEGDGDQLLTIISPAQRCPERLGEVIERAGLGIPEYKRETDKFQQTSLILLVRTDNAAQFSGLLNFLFRHNDLDERSRQWVELFISHLQQIQAQG